MKPEALENIFTELIAVYENLKAEVLVAEIQENSNIKVIDFVISNKSTFSRSYRRDIIDVDSIINKNKLTLNLSRNGLYDTLPEGFFHVQNVNKDAKSYSAQRKTVKQEEQDARLFFAPLENEFFNQRLRIESNERKLLDDFYNLNDDFLQDFWKVDLNIPESYILKLIKLLPYSHKIVGDFELTRLSLQKVLNEKVSFNKTYKKQINAENGGKNNNGEIGYQLGVDTVLDGSANELLNPVLEVTIGPVSENNINKYLKKDEVLDFINTFYDYFIPMEVEVTTKFTVNNEIGFLLDETNGALMGISTHL